MCWRAVKQKSNQTKIQSPVPAGHVFENALLITVYATSVKFVDVVFNTDYREVLRIVFRATEDQVLMFASDIFVHREIHSQTIICRANSSSTLGLINWCCSVFDLKELFRLIQPYAALDLSRLTPWLLQLVNHVTVNDNILRKTIVGY